MPSLSSFFHRKSPSQGKNDDEAGKHSESTPQQQEPAANSNASRNPLQTNAPHYAPGTGPVAHAQMGQANNIGMAGGAFIGSATGGDPITGMLEGQVGANMVMQRIQQEQNHQYYREQALRYRDGLPANGVGPVEGLAPPSQPVVDGRDRSQNRSQGRDERRKKRWERRAKRRDGGGEVEGNEDSSGSEKA